MLAPSWCFGGFSCVLLHKLLWKHTITKVMLHFLLTTNFWHPNACVPTPSNPWAHAFCCSGQKTEKQTETATIPLHRTVGGQYLTQLTQSTQSSKKIRITVIGLNPKKAEHQRPAHCEIWKDLWQDLEDQIREPRFLMLIICMYGLQQAECTG